MKKNVMKKSKRLNLTIISLIANFLILVFGIIKEVDLAALGAAVAMINAPLYGYLWGETARPSGNKNSNQTKIEEEDEESDE